MTIATYADLQTAVAGWLHRADLTSNIPDFVTLADNRISNDLRVRQMETTQASTIASGVISVPTNYIELRDAYISSTTPYSNLDRKNANWIYDHYPYRASTGLPVTIAREGSNFIFGPFPDSNYTVTLVYYNRFAALSASTNSIFTTYPGLWLFASLCEAAPFIKDDKRLALWEAKYKYLFELIQKESNDEEYSGSVLTMVAG
jgi:hypothetical protein